MGLTGWNAHRLSVNSNLVRAIAASLAVYFTAGCGSRCNPSGVVAQNGDVFVSAQEGIVAFDRTLGAHRVVVGRAELMDLNDEAFTVDREGGVFVPLFTATAIAVFRKEAGRTRRAILGRIATRDEALLHIAVDGKGDVYYPALATNAIDVSRFAAGGRPVRVRRIGGIATETGDTQFAVSRDGTVCLTLTPTEIGCLKRNGTDAAHPFARRALSVRAIRGVAFDRRGVLAITTRDPAAVTFFRIGVDGRVEPLGRIAGPRTTLRQPEGIAFSPGGEALVVDNEAHAVVVFAPGARGDIKPERSIVGPGTQLSDPFAIAVRSDGEIFVTNVHSDNGVIEFGARARGNARPTRRVAGNHTRLGVIYSVALDGRGRLYMSNSDNELFALDSHDIAAPPVAWIIQNRSRIRRAAALAVDPGGHLAVASDDGTIALYDVHSRGDAAPIAMLNDVPDPRAEHLQGLAVDSTERSYRVDPDEREVIEYVRSGKRTSRLLLQGKHTALSAPVSVAVDREGDLIVANRDGSIVTFSAGARGDVAPIRVLLGVVKAADAIADTRDRNVYVVSVSPDVSNTGTAGTLTALTASKGLTAKTSFEPVCFGNAI